MIILISGPSGVGKTDVCYSLLVRNEPSVYLDSDWLSAKSPIDPIAEAAIAELYELLRLNVAYHLQKGVDLFFLAVHIKAALHLPEHLHQLAGLNHPVRAVMLTANASTLRQRIEGRDRVEWKKEEEKSMVEEELGRVEVALDRYRFNLVIDTTDKDPGEVGEAIARGLGLKKHRLGHMPSDA
jgi:broad-specificity NMP kinase